ncbi:MAG: hypothetical protein RRY29_05235 [Desulfovibrionaceae bacterium]
MSLEPAVLTQSDDATPKAMCNEVKNDEIFERKKNFAPPRV